MKRIKGLREYRFKDNPLEEKLAKQWAAWNADDERRRILAYLLDEQHDRGGAPPDPTERDGVVAATIIQWLGSPVGQAFLKEAGFTHKGEQ
jgi:hypothetical protein